MENDTAMVNFVSDMNSTSQQDVNNVLIPIWATNVTVVYLAFILIIGSSGNIAILLVQFRNRRKSSTDWLVTCIALFDLMMATICTSTTMIVSLRVWDRLGSDGLCKFHRFLLLWTSFSSTGLLAAIAVDRYYKTCNPHSARFTPRCSKIVCIVVALCGFVLSIPAIFTHGNLPNGKCGINEETVGYIYYAVSALIQALAFAVLLISYFRIGTELRKRFRKVCVQPYVIYEQRNGRNTVNVQGDRSSGQSSGKCPDDTHVQRTPGRKIMHMNTVSHDSTSVERKENMNTDTKCTSRRPITCIASGICVMQERVDSYRTNSLTATANTAANYATTVCAFRIGVLKDEDTPFTGPDIVESQTDQPMRRQESPHTNNDKQACAVNNSARAIIQYKGGLMAQKVNRTTRIMFFITLTCIVTWVILWILSSMAIFMGLKETVLGSVLYAWGMSLFMLNCIANPIFYTALSSQFRKQLKTMISKYIDILYNKLR